ncbi:hypothetical protein ACJX0J_006374 [Zea mays]
MQTSQVLNFLSLVLYLWEVPNLVKCLGTSSSFSSKTAKCVSASWLILKYILHLIRMKAEEKIYLFVNCLLIIDAIDILSVKAILEFHEYYLVLSGVIITSIVILKAKRIISIDYLLPRSFTCDFMKNALLFLLLVILFPNIIYSIMYAIFSLSTIFDLDVNKVFAIITFYLTDFTIKLEYMFYILIESKVWKVEETIILDLDGDASEGVRVSITHGPRVKDLNGIK